MEKLSQKTILLVGLAISSIIGAILFVTINRNTTPQLQSAPAGVILMLK